MTRRRMAAIVSWGIMALASGAVVGRLTERCLAASPQTTLGSGFHSAGDSFFENTGVNFGFNIPAGGRSGIVGLTPQGAINPGGINFGQGGAAAALPPFGGFVPNSGNTFGFTINGGGGSATFGFSGSQGASSSLGSQTPTVTLITGGEGSISVGSLHPFVTSITPVVGGLAGGGQPMFGMPAPPVDSFGTSSLGERLQRWGEPTGPRNAAPLAAGKPNGAAAGAGSLGGTDQNPVVAAAPQDQFTRELTAARQSTAGQPAAGIAEIRAQQAAADQAADAELRQILARAEEAMALGKPNVARIYYQQLARRATGALKQQALDGLKATAPQSASSPNSVSP